MADQNIVLQVVVSILSGILGGFGSKLAYEEFKRQKTTESVELIPEERDGIFIHARVVNHSKYIVKNCWVYISIKHKQTDILSVNAATIGPGSVRPVTDDRLCWCLIGNPPNIDILPHEPQRLFIAFVDQAGMWIAFASEKGSNPARIYLSTGRKYDVTFKIVSESTTGITYTATIDPKDISKPIKNLVRQ